MAELNAEQRAAAQETKPDFVLSAAAGSGKTRVLTERFASRVASDGDVAFESTLAITFTEKAAGELWQRVRARVSEDRPAGPGMDRAWISTIHSMCSRLLRRHALEVGLDPRFVVGSGVELGVIREQVFEQIALQTFDEGAPDSPARTLFRSFGMSRLFELIVDITEQVRASGLVPGGIVTLEPPDSRDFQGAVTTLERLASEYAGLSETVTIMENRASLGALIESAHIWLSGALPAGEFVREARAFKQARRGAQVKEIADEILSLREELLLVAAQHAVRPYEMALIDLVDRFFCGYALARKRVGIVDFQDLQELVAELFSKHPKLADRYAAQFSSVMVDEFQDTDVLQVRLIGSLAPDGFMAVGDERQSIYRFRYADVDIFKQRVEQADACRTLRTNYRSHPELVSLFNEMFDREPFWPGDFLHVEPGRTDVESDSGDPRATAIFVDVASCGPDKDADEAVILAAHISDLIDKGADAGDIVILLRAMTAAETFAGALRDSGVAVFVASGGTYFDCPEVVDLEMLLRLVANTKDTEALLHVLAGPMTALSHDALALLRLTAGPGSLWAACRNGASLDLSADDQGSLARVVEVVEWLRAGAGRSGLADMIHEACERLEYDLTLFARGFDGARAWANVLKLARIAESFEQDSPGDPQAFLEYLQLKRDLEGRESLAAFAAEGVDAVRIMSIHAAKGLEFPITVVANLGRGHVGKGPAILSAAGGAAFLGMRLPVSEDGRERIDTLGYRRAAEAERDADSAEERRLFYVACTRAEDRLVLCGRTDFAKEAEEGNFIGWLRQSLGFTGAGSVFEGDIALGDATVRVLAPAPSTCGPVGTARPASEPRAMEIARTTRSSPGHVVHYRPERISYSGLALYEACPYRYYVTGVARLGSRSPDGTGNAEAVALGNAVHAVLRTAVEFELPSQERVHEICRTAGLPATAESEVARLAGEFLGSETALRAAGSSRVAREMPFAVPLGDTLLDGALDMIAWEGDSALIVDYKTGGADRQIDAEAYRTQAECYAVAAFAMGASLVEVRFVALRQACQATVFEYGIGDAGALRAKIESRIESLRHGEYEPLRRYDPFACPECPVLGNLCPVSAPGRKPAV